jgi:hypothetical protein
MIDLYTKSADCTPYCVMLLGEGCQIFGKWRKFGDEWKWDG